MIIIIMIIIIIIIIIMISTPSNTLEFGGKSQLPSRPELFERWITLSDVIRQIIRHLVDSVVCSVNIYPLDSYVSFG